MVSQKDFRCLCVYSDNGPFTAFVTPRIVSKEVIELEAGICFRREGGKKAHVTAKQLFSELDYQNAEAACEAAVHWLKCHLESIVFSLECMCKDLENIGNFTRE